MSEPVPVPALSPPVGRRRRQRRTQGERGQVAPLVALLIVAAGGLALGLGHLGGDAVDAAQARTAADAAALAGAAEGQTAAREIAMANGGELVSFLSEGLEVQVQVGVGEALAEARATRSPLTSAGAPAAASGGVTVEP